MGHPHNRCRSSAYRSPYRGAAVCEKEMSEHRTSSNRKSGQLAECGVGRTDWADLR